MILTGEEIRRVRAEGGLVIEPFDDAMINPNSYNFRLGDSLTVYLDAELDPRRPPTVASIPIPPEGYVLQAGQLYLAHTMERLGGLSYVPTFAARSSVARMGVFVHLSAGLGDIGFVGQWTLQLYAVHATRIYPGMQIGQMMWWRPQGRIEHYEGKYQFSMGAQPSLAWRDSVPSPPWLPGLVPGLDANEVGAKFARLAQASGSHPVPTAFCVPADALEAIVPDETRSRLRTAYEDIVSTGGALTRDGLAAIGRAAGDLRLVEPLRTAVIERLRQQSAGRVGIEFAVRSSAVGEDGETSSSAGAYQTVLGLQAEESVIAAIESCWRSYYHPTALAARLRHGDLDATRTRIAVIVQEMVDAAQAGVAFTRDGDTVVIEAVDGLGAELMNGATAPRSCIVEFAKSVAEPLHRAVAELALDLRSLLGFETDVEWAVDADGMVWLIQVRPVTTVGTDAVTAGEPWIRVSPLYGDVPDGMTLGSVARIRDNYVAKRLPVYRLARQLGIAVPSGWLVNINGLALDDPRSTLPALPLGAAAEYVVDVSDSMRQITIDADGLVELLRTVVTTSKDRRVVHAVLIRPYLVGDAGVISSLEPGRVILDHSAHGLLALNRGFGDSTTSAVDIDSVGGDLAVTGDPLPRAVAAALPQIMQATRALGETLGAVALEWVISERSAVFVDYSALDATASSSDTTVSDGVGIGPLMRLDLDEPTMMKLSVGPTISVGDALDPADHSWAAELIERARAFDEPPVVSAARPYAALSVLVGHVAGFVFEQAAMMCHLSIILREAGVPAVLSAELPDASVVCVGGGTVRAMPANLRAAT